MQRYNGLSRQELEAVLKAAGKAHNDMSLPDERREAARLLVTEATKIHNEPPGPSFQDQCLELAALAWQRFGNKKND